MQNTRGLHAQRLQRHRSIALERHVRRFDTAQITFGTYSAPARLCRHPPKEARLSVNWARAQLSSPGFLNSSYTRSWLSTKNREFQGSQMSPIQQPTPQGAAEAEGEPRHGPAPSSSSSASCPNCYHGSSHTPYPPYPGQIPL